MWDGPTLGPITNYSATGYRVVQKRNYFKLINNLVLKLVNEARPMCFYVSQI